MHGRILAAVFFACTATGAVSQLEAASPQPCGQTNQYDANGTLIVSATDPCAYSSDKTSPALSGDPKNGTSGNPTNADTDPANEGDTKSATSAPNPYTGPGTPPPVAKLKPGVVAPNAKSAAKRACEKECK